MMKLIIEIPDNMTAEIDKNGKVVISMPDSYYWNGYKNSEIGYITEFQHPENKLKRTSNGILQFEEHGNKFLR